MTRGLTLHVEVGASPLSMKRVFTEWSELGPAVGGPADGALDEDAGAIVGNAIAMTNKDILVINMVSSTMASSLKLFLIALDEEITSAKAHVNTTAIKIRTINRFAAAYSHTVVTLATLTAVVP